MPQRRRKDSPYKIVTAGTWARRVLCTVGCAVGVAGVWVLLSVMTGVLPSPWDAISGACDNATSNGQVGDGDDAVAGDEATSPASTGERKDTVEGATDTIASYYSALATNDASKLHEIGAIDAAKAIEQGWLARINYRVHDVGGPDAAALPRPVGEYAGNALYAISDFYSNGGNAAVSSDVTGDTGHVGWVYFDTMTGTWAIVDPTIPTSIQTPSTTSVSLSSTDGTSSVRLTSIGSLSNPWWAMASVSVMVKTSSSVSVTKAEFDDGVTVSYPDGLVGTIEGERMGDVTMVRGVTGGFPVDRIGQEPLVLTGDMCPCVLQTAEQNITPTFTFGSE